MMRAYVYRVLNFTSWGPKALAKASDEEMCKTFNMGMGFCIMAEKGEVDGILKVLEDKVEAKVVGEVVDGKGVSLPKLGLRY